MYAKRSNTRVENFVVRGKFCADWTKVLRVKTNAIVYRCVRDRSSENNYVHEYMCMCFVLFVCLFACLFACLLFCWCCFYLLLLFCFVFLNIDQVKITMSMNRYTYALVRLSCRYIYQVKLTMCMDAYTYLCFLLLQAYKQVYNLSFYIYICICF